MTTPTNPNQRPGEYDREPGPDEHGATAVGPTGAPTGGDVRKPGLTDRVRGKVDDLRSGQDGPGRDGPGYDRDADSTVASSTGGGPDQGATHRTPDFTDRDPDSTDRTATDMPATAAAAPTTDVGYADDRGATAVQPAAAPVLVPDPNVSRREVVARQKAEFGGLKMGSAFFGWLTATGTAVLLTALVAGTGAALGLGQGATAQDAAANANTIGLGGGITLLVIIFISYFVGGYVAGRMARFSGAKQGLGVWLWALIIAVVVAIIGVIAGARFDVLASLNGFPRIPINEGRLTTAGIITAVGLAVVSLLGAVVGGLAGMRYHRRIDRAGFVDGRTASEV